MTCKPNRHRQFCTVKVKKYRRNNIYSSFLRNFSAVLEYCFSSALSALKYLYPLDVGFFKAKLRFPTLFAMPPLLFCINLLYNDKKFIIYLRTAKNERKLQKFLQVLEYGLPFTEFYQRNDENRTSGALRCFDSF
jgi:hypothetical protein